MENTPQLRKNDYENLFEKREALIREINRLKKEGFSNLDIAKALELEESTVIIYIKEYQDRLKNKTKKG